MSLSNKILLLKKNDEVSYYAVPCIDIRKSIKNLNDIFITGKWEAEHIKEILFKEFGVKLSSLTGGKS